MNELKTTSDGSHTFFCHETGEHFHSVYGAITESQHIFINNGLAGISKKEVVVFEAGFGTGLNALLTLLYCSNKNIKVNYLTVEKYPINPELAGELNYPSVLGTDPLTFLNLHKTPWETETEITSFFSLKKIKTDISSFVPDFKADIIYYDCFSPETQPELWSAGIFGQLQKMLNPGGVLVSYCVKGIVKQALRQNGFTVKTLPGPPGKRHMLYALK